MRKTSLFTDVLGGSLQQTTTEMHDLVLPTFNWNYTKPDNYSQLNISYSGNSNETNVSHYGNQTFICTLFYDHAGVMLSHVISLISSMVCIIIGLIGNILSCLVFSGREMRHISSNIYLLMLAVSDSLYLIGILCSKVLHTMHCLYFQSSHMDIYNRSNFVCKTVQYVLDLCSDYSTCLILAFTIERFIAVYAAAQFKTICTVRRANIVCLVIFLVISISIAPYHFMFMKLESQWGTTYCAIQRSSEKLFSTLYLSEMTLFRVAPVCIIASINISIICKVMSLNRKRQRWRLANRSRRDDKSMQLTLMLIIVSTTYVILYMPVLTFFLIHKLRREGLIGYIPPDPLFVFRNYAQALYVAGHSVNFFLYTVSGKVFREHLQILVCDRRRAERVNENGIELLQLNNTCTNVTTHTAF